MQYKNAHFCVKRIFTAEVLQIIVSVIVASGGIMNILLSLLLQAAQQHPEFPVLQILRSVASVIVVVLSAGSVFADFIAMVLVFTGLRRGRKDEKQFKNAMIANLFLLTFSAAVFLVDLIFRTEGVIGALLNLPVTVTEIIMILFIVRGITNLSERLHDTVTANRGRDICRLLAAVLIFCALLRTAPVLYLDSENYHSISGGFSFAYGYLSVGAYVIYLFYLRRGMKMLQRSAE